MLVDYVLILAAGKGTRMGSIGKKKPKVTWPIFKRSIIELEYLYAKKYCKKDIYINLFNYKDKIKRHVNLSPILNNVVIIEEQEVLDIGGAIHNLANKVGHKGKLLVINSDQFIMLNKEKWKEFYEMSNNFDSVVLTYNVLRKDKYNETQVLNNKLVDIIANNNIQTQKHETYTGMSIINLEKLDQNAGESKFFESVADFKNKNIGALNIQDSQYWDFGTLNRYYNSMFEILRKWNSNSPFINFLKENLVLDESKISKNSYGTDEENVIDLADNKKIKSNTIYLNQSKVPAIDDACIVCDDIIDCQF